MYSLQSSQKRLLTNFNPVFVTLFVLVLILVKSTSEAIVPSSLKGWDLLLPVVIFVGQRRGLLEGTLLILFIGHLYSLNSSAPVGLFIVFYLLIFGIARALSYVIYAHSSASVLVLLMVFSFFSRLLLPLVARFFDQHLSLFSWGNFSLWGMFVTTVAGFIIYWMLSLLDLFTFKVAPRNIELGESSL